MGWFWMEGAQFWNTAASEFHSSYCISWIYYDLLAGFLPECVARVPVSLWGSGGWGCSLDVAQPSATFRNRPQPFAFVRNRSQPFATVAWGPYGRAYGKFCKRGHFWRFHMWCCFVSRGRRGTFWHSEVFCNVSKVVLCGRRNTFATFSQDELRFSWHAQHFGDLCRHFVWQVQHFRRVALPALHSTLCTPHSTLHPLHFTFHCLHSTL